MWLHVFYGNLVVDCSMVPLLPGGMYHVALVYCSMFRKGGNDFEQTIYLPLVAKLQARVLHFNVSAYMYVSIAHNLRPVFTRC